MPPTRTAPETEAAPPAAASAAPRIELGWVFDARLEDVDREAAEAARQDLEALLRESFPEFEWHLPWVRREMAHAPVEEPVALLEVGVLELSLHHWDLALVLGAADLHAHESAETYGAVSRSLGVGALSTFRLDPLARSAEAGVDERRAALRRRVGRIALHAFGHLAGLRPRSGQEGEPGDPMRAPSGDGELDREVRFDAAQREELRRELAGIADERVEESGGASGGATFWVRSLWRNRYELVENVVRSRPWELPARLGRLTAAAVSAQALLLVTAESWEVGTRLGGATATWLALGSITVTSTWVLRRQRLLALHRVTRPTEQAVVTRVSVVLFVLAGFVVTWTLLLGLALALGAALFPTELVARWSGLEPVGASAYLFQAMLTASLGILVGALGASFEGASRVRHVAYVDEEL